MAILASLLAFFSSAVGRWVGVGLVGVGLYVAGDIRGRAAERTHFEQAQAEAERQRVARDTLETQRAADDATRREAGLDDLNRKESESDAEYAKRLAKRAPTAVCTLGDDDLR